MVKNRKTETTETQWTESNANSTLLSIENLSIFLWCCDKYLYLSPILVIFKVTWFRLFLLSFTAVIFTIIITFLSTKRVFTAAIPVVKLSTIFVSGVFIVIWPSSFTAPTILITSTISSKSTTTISTPFTPWSTTTFNFNVYCVSVNNNALQNCILKISKY